jgi:hypothetical protein
VESQTRCDVVRFEIDVEIIRRIGEGRVDFEALVLNKDAKQAGQLDVQPGAKIEADIETDGRGIEATVVDLQIRNNERRADADLGLNESMWKPIALEERNARHADHRDRDHIELKIIEAARFVGRWLVVADAGLKPEVEKRDD